jgi:CRP-like cAMP-binding protein
MSEGASDPRYRELVRRVDIFQGLTPDDVQKIFSKGMTLKVQKGDTIFHKGTTGNQMYVVLAGKVGIFDGPKLLNELPVGSTFGEMSLLNNEPRSATAVANELTNLFALDERVFERLLEKRVAVQILMNIARMMSRRLKDANLKLRESEGR